MTVAKAKAKLDKIFSQFIRLRAVNDEGWGRVLHLRSLTPLQKRGRWSFHGTAKDAHAVR